MLENMDEFHRQGISKAMTVAREQAQVDHDLP
jgi:hypothetical protein